MPVLPQIEPLRLVSPAPVYLPSYRAALEAGWSPDPQLGNLATQRELDQIDRDPMNFLMSLDDPRAKGPPVPGGDGRLHPPLPSYRRWMWDGAFCGAITFQWQDGTSELPPHVSGHIIFGVTPWKRGNGHATRALKLVIPDARARGLSYVQLCVPTDNDAARRSIEHAGGLPFEGVNGGGAQQMLYRISL